jgi:hypothetical protein
VIGPAIRGISVVPYAFVQEQAKIIRTVASHKADEADNLNYYSSFAIDKD